MQGPIELNALVPYVQSAFDRSGVGLAVTISGVRLGIDRRNHELHLWAEDAQVALPNGERLATFPELQTSLSIGSLLRGQIAPTQVSVERPVLHLKRHAGGGFTFRVGNLDDGAPDLGPQVLDVLDGLVGGGPEQTALGSLRRLRMHDATVIVDDKTTDRRWRATHVDAAIRRQAGAIEGDVSLALPVAGNAAEMQAGFRYEPAQQKADVALAVEGVEPASLAPLFPELRPLGQLRSTVSGTLSTRLDLRGGKSEGIRLDLALGPGRLENPAFPGGALDLSRGEIHALYAPEKSQLQLTGLTLDLGGGATLALSGSLQGVTPEALAGQVAAPTSLPGKLDAVLSHVPASRLEKIWPAALMPGGRRWVLANVHDGVLDEASAQLSLKLNGANYQADFASAQGSLRYHDLTVTYFNGLVPARKVSGTATFSDKRAEFVPTGGAIKDVKITGGSVVLSDLGAPVEWMTSDLAVSGPLQQVLEVIDAKPLQYAHSVGLDPARVGGKADAQLHVRLPMLADLKLEAVDYGVKGTLAGVSISKALLDRDLTDGNLSMDIAKTGLRLKGNARFDGVPVALAGEVPFHPNGETQARYHVVTRLDDEGRRRLKLDFAPEQVTGPVAMDVVYVAKGAGRGEATASLDLREASMGIVEAGWKKPAGAPGTAKLVFDVEHGAVTRLPQFDIKAAGLDGRFSLALTPEHQVDRVEIKHLSLGETDVAGAVMRRPGGGWRTDLRGARLDASRLVKLDRGPGDPSAPALAIAGRFDRLLLGPRRELHGVSLQMLRTGGVWQSLQLDSRLPNGRQLAAQLGAEGAARHLVIQSDDFGATLNLFGVTDNIVGGRLAIDGQVIDPGGKQTIRGRVEASNYSLVRAPAFAQVLGMASLNGLASALAGAGVPFTKLRADFSYTPERVSLGRVVAYGASIGVTANGWLDLDRDWMELQGSLAPAYALNSFPGYVPILGTLLTGGEGEGVFAANYRLSGPTDNPQVSVNPLSAIAPGFLRKLFEFAPPPQDQPQQSQAPAQ